MKTTLVTRALALACLVAAGGTAHGAFDELSSPPASVQTQTWYFPDGSNHTVLLTPSAGVAGAPDTRVLGAGPASMAAVLPDEGAEQDANVVTQTWYFPDGSNHTVLLASAPGASAPDTTVLGAGADSRGSSALPRAGNLPLQSNPFAVAAP